MPAEPPLITRLRAIGPVKTWSLLVTVFGDQRAGPDRALTGARLGGLFAHMGVKPEALRVALHRLNKTGWIDSRKTGRTSAYFMTPSSLGETSAVRDRVYAGHGAGQDPWFVVMPHQNDQDDACDPLRLGPGNLLVPQSRLKTYPDALALPLLPERVPDWAVHACLPDDMRGLARDLRREMTGLDPDALAENTWQAGAIHMLILHHWRRLALRDGAWAHMFLRPDGDVAACQKDLRRLLGGRSRDLPQD